MNESKSNISLKKDFTPNPDGTINDDTINPQSQGNGDGGGNDMRKNDYVTHEELNHATDNLSNEIKLLGKDIDNKFEKINTKFAEQRTWSIVTFITIVASLLGIYKFF